MHRILNIPLMVILMGVGATAMLVPAFYGLAVNDHLSARAFGYSAFLFYFIVLMVGLATYNNKNRNVARSHLLALPLAYAGLPLMLAVPFNEAVRDTTFVNAYLEMVSSLTTTGATSFDDPARLRDSVHLWRALVGWMGGFFVWVTALAILAPKNLGGFEVISSATIGRGARKIEEHVRNTDPRALLLRYSQQLLPIYTGLTGALWLALILSGESAFVAACHAMSTLATSGISPIGGLENSTTGFPAELLIFIFFIFALTRQTFTPDTTKQGLRRLRNDPEFMLAGLIVLCVPAFLFFRHWLGAYDVDEQQNLSAALHAAWGSVFSVMSFLSTTGFSSADWELARNWSGLQTPGLVLVGLALVGGGVATTAGGVKLLRVYALYKHGLREMDKLVHPSSVGGAGALARHIRGQGAYVAWVFFMLFALSIALVMTALALTGLSFETATILTISALSTTGPLTQVASADPISFAALPEAAKLILSAAMVLGRLETLAIIALLNPEFWRQ
ncbi:trk system potassium uptake protein TrkH [Actibacterium atlanticum]|uniref:Trk system potassium uptake protein TrkH n=1 Tax=Actibacterium atlanticum TaxID=1461693 RepID=A0A058ZRH1_9RHOB|nr:potassium transporter TrkG [Actibacterium atlanticum]KCV83727.1 trk system potassium uptake protein TrkH [Actibacterium atlanticum]